ncbi:MAG TPA: nickel pincer cofactor biosynthesis protein LarC [Thermoanaerobaculia bacterium]|nr:nickel pincer cofactor biosynthesis protein LarC [Thermoanaerobaculia bacterium]
MADHYHLDCSSGIAGDMFLGACLDLGMPLDVLHETVARLRLPNVSVESRKASRGGFVGTRFRVLVDGKPLEGPDPEEQQQQHHHHHHYEQQQHHHHSHSNHHHHRGLAQIQELIQASDLAEPVKERAIRLFQRLGEAEAKAHGMPVDRVHFHEVGAIDSIVDLVGAAAAVEHLSPGRITCGQVNVGGGRVRTQHGELPVPAPATAELLRGIPIFGGPGGELTTPTGAVLLAELVDEYVDFPSMILEGTGYGLGKKDLPDRPNAVRLLRGRGRETRAEVMIVECEVDDLPGEGFGFLMERLLDAGALEVYFTPVQMKKNRPGTLITMLCRRHQLEGLAGILLMESGSLGCRYSSAARFEAEREITEVETAFGTVRVKRARLNGRPLAAAPEFEDCRRLALASGVPWRDIYRAALLAAGQP